MHGGDAADIVAVYAIAERLGKFAHEVLEMPASEMSGWVAYIDYSNKLKRSHGS